MATTTFLIIRPPKAWRPAAAPNCYLSTLRIWPHVTFCEAKPPGQSLADCHVIVFAVITSLSSCSLLSEPTALMELSVRHTGVLHPAQAADPTVLTCESTILNP